MPAINFQSRFAAAVESGAKLQTIRAVRRLQPLAKGQWLYLYTGMRTPAVRQLGQAECSAVYRVRVWSNFVEVGERRVLELDEFARRDGFGCWSEMSSWFRAQYSAANRAAGRGYFEGVLIRWATIGPPGPVRPRSSNPRHRWDRRSSIIGAVDVPDVRVCQVCDLHVERAGRVWGIQEAGGAVRWTDRLGPCPGEAEQQAKAPAPR